MKKKTYVYIFITMILFSLLWATIIFGHLKYDNYRRNIFINHKLESSII